MNTYKYKITFQHANWGLMELHLLAQDRPQAFGKFKAVMSAQRPNIVGVDCVKVKEVKTE